MTRPDIAVVGGGLLGRCLAWRASRAGARVALYDAASYLGENSAAWVAAGMIAPTTGAIDTDAQIAFMGNHSLELWPQWLAELSVPVFYRDHGTLLLWHRENVGEASRARKILDSRQPEATVRASHAMKVHLAISLGEYCSYSMAFLDSSWKERKHR